MKTIIGSLWRMAIAAVLVLALSVSAEAAGADWEAAVVRADGYGLPGATASPAQAELMARRAAIADAYRALAEQTESVAVTSETTVRNLMLESDTVQTRVSAAIRGAKVVSGGWENGSYHVVVEMPIYGAGSLASAVLPETKTPEPLPAPTTKVSINVEITKEAGAYTGLVVDCRGLGLSPAMSPVILNANGQKIYGYKNLESKKVIHSGMAGYAKDLAGASRAGSRPLVVKAIRTENHGFNPVLSVADADLVLTANQTARFLENCSVVFLR